MTRYRLPLLNAVLLLALAGSRWGSHAESAASMTTGRLEKDFLRGLSLPFRDWSIANQALSPLELDVLQPDATLLRRYRSPEKDVVELSVIAGHQKRSVHTPAYCMPGGGWETLAMEKIDLSLPGRSVPATRSVMRSEDGQDLVATYFFTDGEYATRDVVRLQGRQLLKRFRGEAPLSALVRIIVYIRRNDSEAARLSDAFARETVPAVMERLRQARRKADREP